MALGALLAAAMAWFTLRATRPDAGPSPGDGPGAAATVGTNATAPGASSRSTGVDAAVSPRTSGEADVRRDRVARALRRAEWRPLARRYGIDATVVDLLASERYAEALRALDARGSAGDTGARAFLATLVLPCAGGAPVLETERTKALHLAAARSVGASAARIEEISWAFDAEAAHRARQHEAVCAEAARQPGWSAPAYVDAPRAWRRTRDLRVAEGDAIARLDAARERLRSADETIRRRGLEDARALAAVLPEAATDAAGCIVRNCVPAAGTSDDALSLFEMAARGGDPAALRSLAHAGVDDPVGEGRGGPPVSPRERYVWRALEDALAEAGCLGYAEYAPRLARAAPDVELMAMSPAESDAAQAEAAARLVSDLPGIRAAMGCVAP